MVAGAWFVMGTTLYFFLLLGAAFWLLEVVVADAGFDLGLSLCCEVVSCYGYIRLGGGWFRGEKCVVVNGDGLGIYVVTG